MIEKRYERLVRGERRPSCEYLEPDEIRKIFTPFVADTEKFEKLTDEQLIDFYDQWFHRHFIDQRYRDVFLPTIEE